MGRNTDKADKRISEYELSKVCKCGVDCCYIFANGGPFGTVPELLFEKKGLVSIVQQLLIAYRT